MTAEKRAGKLIYRSPTVLKIYHIDYNILVYREYKMK